MKNIKTKQNGFPVRLIALLLLLFLSSIKAQAQTTAVTDDATAITGAMNNSAADWNKGNLDAFMSLYDASATMMSHCLFPDIGKRYESPLARRLK